MSMRWMHPRRAFGWIFAAFIGLIGLLIAASLVAWVLRGVFFFPFGFGFGWFFLFLFFLFFWGFRWWGWGWGWGRWGWYGRPGWGGYRDEAHEILRSRYARGEITKDQFDQMMRDLDQHPQP